MSERKISRVSIIIATRNRLTFLRQALNSVKEQTFQDFEVIVVNDGGEDISPVIKDFSDLKIITITNPENFGTSYARNEALGVASGEFFAFLDDDDIYLPNHLAYGLDSLEKNNCDLYYNKVYISKIRSDSENEIKKNSLVHGYEFDSEIYKSMCFTPFSSVIVRRTDKKFDTSLKVCEDWDYWLQLINSGYKPFYDKRITSVYFRVPVEHSFSNEALSLVSNYVFFYDCWKAIIKKNKISEQNEMFIRMDIFERACIGKLSNNQNLPHFYFEEFTALMFKYKNKNRDELIVEINKLLNE